MIRFSCLDEALHKKYYGLNMLRAAFLPAEVSAQAD